MTDYVSSWTDALERRRQARITEAAAHKKRRALMNLALSEREWHRQRAAYMIREDLHRRTISLDDAFDSRLTPALVQPPTNPYPAE